ncbi:non-ribosomal peptide synthetase [Nocardia sp. NPDC056000]|uniref:non-ribosomal peptide synthetase n=1 Tax=Nocardia sp. NPDC056000 TaxID=3345674 RepID=UPI0035E083FB
MNSCPASADSARPHPAGFAVRLGTPTGGTGELSELIRTALGGDPERLGIWYERLPFASTSARAGGIVRQQLAHPLVGRTRARVTCTEYSDAVTDVVVLADSDFRPLLTDLVRRGAHPIPGLTPARAARMAIREIDLGPGHRAEEIAAAVVLVLTRFLDTPAIRVDLAAFDALLESPAYRARLNSQAGTAACDVELRGSIKDLVSRLDALTPDSTPADGSDSGLRSVRIIDFRTVPGAFLPGPAAPHDFDIAIHPTTDPHAARILLSAGDADAMEFVDDIADVLARVCAQINAAGLDLPISDIHFSPAVPAVAPIGEPISGPGERLEQRIAAHAAARPAAVAVRDESGAVSFGELDARSERIAAGLLELGVRPGDFVVIAAATSARTFATMMAIWKCGAAYVPVDIEFPVDRLRYIIEDSGARVAVVEAELLAGLPDSVRAVDISTLTARQSTATALPKALPGQGAAYAIYTSGTTGRPKGTVIAHRSALALFDALTTEFALSAEDVWSAFHSPAFDFSVWEIWGALVTGGTVAVVPKSLARDPQRFHALLRQHGVTVLSQTPPAFAHLVSADAAAAALDTVRLVVLGGDALQATSSSAWLDRYPASRCRLVNMYGITETTVHVTVQSVSKHTALCAPRSVGRAIAGWDTAVLGPDLRPAPVGFPGEIFVAGSGLALYYTGNPALTARKFVAGPDGRRWYRSGDLGRVRADGTLEHLGRIDHQIKINGYRIELDEIRNSIARQPGVRDAIVVCNRAGGRFGTARLDAYVVGAGVDLSELRGAVERVLPVYMRPASYTTVDAIPLTTNGKVDLGRLPDPNTGPLSIARTAEPAAESAGAQSILGRVWSSILGVEPHDDDNFFLSGGNSLAAIHLSTELSGNGVTMPLSLLYQRPVFKDLRTALEETA